MLHIQPRVRSEILSKDENEANRSVSQDSPSSNMLSCEYVHMCESMFVSQVREQREEIYFPSFSQTHQCSERPFLQTRGSVCRSQSLTHCLCVSEVGWTCTPPQRCYCGNAGYPHHIHTSHSVFHSYLNFSSEVSMPLFFYGHALKTMSQCFPW